jgi:hypothetical protein
MGPPSAEYPPPDCCLWKYKFYFPKNFTTPDDVNAIMAPAFRSRRLDDDNNDSVSIVYLSLFWFALQLCDCGLDVIAMTTESLVPHPFLPSLNDACLAWRVRFGSFCYCFSSICTFGIYPHAFIRI